MENTTIANPEPAKVISHASECMRRLMEAGLSYEDLQTPINDPEMRQRLVQYWKTKAHAIPSGNLFPVSVDYSTTLEQMIAEGKYDWSNSDINSKNFPTASQVGQVTVNVELVHFNRNIGSEEALQELDKVGYRPANLSELLAFGAKYPDRQREFPIVALGSVWQRLDGNRYVAYIYYGGVRRHLYLVWIELWYVALYRFAAVRK